MILEKEAILPPQSDLEIRLHTLWAELLNMDASAFGVEDSFFLLGGNSLTAMTFTQRLYAQGGLDCSLAAFYQHATIRELAAFLEPQQTVHHLERGTL